MFLILFKYAGLISLPLFGLIGYYLFRHVPEFVWSKQKVSKLIYYLEHSRHRWIFRSNFLVKALLDLCFSLYVIETFHLSYFSPLALMLLISSLLFASLAYFTVDTHYTLHKIIIYIYGVILAISYICLAHLTQDPTFIIFTYATGIITSIITFYALMKKKTNVYTQIFCTSILYLWLFWFVMKYL